MVSLSMIAINDIIYQYTNRNNNAAYDGDDFSKARNRACKSRDLVFISKTSGALRLSLRYFNVEIPIQKVKFVFEDAVDEQFAELSKHFA